ncbi:hypothetical protein M0638_16110 [Roseomonas sp. NAR14]|uniref:Uncharacterized protein n=1 Tax=Roseomonas acroporae TaxID=2937791 RepID=A0A9X1Y8J6_9PROT|nr:hypothetical protein [Roseomonas acroporae]MCK8785904.1 hypothetical protein [Roseomonas acroporae]
MTSSNDPFPGPSPFPGPGAAPHAVPAAPGGAEPLRETPTLTPRAVLRSLPAARLRPARLLAWLPLLGFLCIVLAPPLNHDVAAVLNFSERWVAGERLYTDLIDVNPPLIFVLSAIPAAIAHWLPLVDGPQALLLCLLLLYAGVWRLCARLRAGRAEGPVEAAVLTVAVPLLCLVAGYDFGQREQIMAVLALPYLLLADLRVEGPRPSRRLVLATALLAGLGFALKPHFLAIPALVEGLVLLRRGPARAFRDPVPWTMAGVWLLYLASLPVLFPDYTGYVLPLVWDYYLDLGGLAWWQVVFGDKLGAAVALLLPLAAVAFLAPAFRRGRNGGTLAQSLALAGIGAIASAWAQHKGWSYHVLPVRMFAATLGLVLAARWLDGALSPARARLSAPALAAGAAFALAAYGVTGTESPWRQISYADSSAGRFAAWLRQQAQDERLLVLSPDIYPVYPALNYAGAQSTLRTMNLWLLQGVYERCPANGARYRETWEMSRAEFFVYRTVAEDFARTPPAAVLVSRNPGIPWCGSEFDFLAYFGRHPLFAETFRRYRPAGELAGYRLYLRED